MWCILEGIDGAGKSTFADKLRAALEEQGLAVDLLHRGVPERDVLDEYQHDVEDYRPGTGRGIVSDRWHFGDIVYGNLYRGFSYLGGPTGAGFRFVELFLKSRGAITVLVDGDEATIKSRLLSRGEDYLKLEHIDYVLREYRQIYKASTSGVLSTPDPTVDLILRQANFWATAAQDLNPFTGYVGGRTPRVLLVGEKRGRDDTPSACAFRPTTKGNSASFLLESLPQSLWKEVGMINAYEEDDIPGLLDVLANPPVIALGRKASEKLTSLEIEHAGLPHPAHMRRFHSSETVNYGQKIHYFIGKTDKEFSWPQ